MNTHITTTPLVYKGEIIRDKGDMLSLTDMWKASGGYDSKRPYEWSRKEGAPFVEAVSLSLNTPVERIYTATKGKGGSTFAHWQIGLAYAKYLSPEFHMWCNQVVREHMEGKPAVAAPMVMDDETRKIFGGIVKSVVHSQLTEVMPQLVAGYVAEHNLSIADGLTSGEVCHLSGVSEKYPRGVSSKVSGHMSRFCAVRNISVPVTRLGRVRAMVFPTHAAREWLDLEGRGLIKRWVEEKNGQQAMRLSPPKHEPEVATRLREFIGKRAA
jgi:hypothetical protein